MSDTPAPLGRISWTDLTVPDATGLHEFYTKVTGWTAMPRSMGKTGRYAMIQDPAGAVCALFESITAETT